MVFNSVDVWDMWDTWDTSYLGHVLYETRLIWDTFWDNWDTWDTSYTGYVG